MLLIIGILIIICFIVYLIEKFFSNPDYKNYRVKSITEIDICGNEVTKLYYIQYRKKLLFYKYWEDFIINDNLGNRSLEKLDELINIYKKRTITRKETIVTGINICEK